MSTGSLVPGWCQDGKSTAVRMPAGPACRNFGCGWGRFGAGASDAIGCGCPPPAPCLLTVTDRSLLARSRRASTVAPPAAVAELTPGSVATSASPPGP